MKLEEIYEQKIRCMDLDVSEWSDLAENLDKIINDFLEYMGFEETPL